MPDWRETIRGRLAELRLDGAAEAEVIEELAQHLEDRYGELRAGGVSEEEAQRLVLAELQENKTLEEQLRKTRIPALHEPAAINESFAKYFWPNADALGKRLRYSWDEKDWMQVIGITRDMKHYGLD